jgi:translation initiation factor 4E
MTDRYLTNSSSYIPLLIAAHGHKGSSGGISSPTSDVGTPASVAAPTFGSFGMLIGDILAWRGKQ